jgi:hypothetical protein
LSCPFKPEIWFFGVRRSISEPVFDSEQSSEFRGVPICDNGTMGVNYLITKPTADCSEVSKSEGPL